MVTSFYYNDQNPSGVCFLVQIKAFCYSNLAGITKFEHERKNERVLVVVVKCRHRANGLFDSPAPGDLSPFSPLHVFPDISCYSLSIPSKKIMEYYIELTETLQTLFCKFPGQITVVTLKSFLRLIFPSL